MATIFPVATPDAAQAAYLPTVWHGDAYALLQAIDRQAAGTVRYAVNPARGYAWQPVHYIRQVDSGVWRISLNFPGLIGPMGVLPQYDQTSLYHVPTATRQANTAFFDVFHHRLITLGFRGWQQARPLMRYSEQQADALLDKQALAQLAPMSSVPTACRLYLQSQILALHRPVLSGSVISACIAEFCRVPVTWVSHCLDYVSAGVSEQTRLGINAHENRLGVSAWLGARMPTRMQHGVLQIGPLTKSVYTACLPGGVIFQAMQTLVRALFPKHQRVRCRLILTAQAVPGLALGPYAQLGYSSWLTTYHRQSDCDDAVFSLF